jgi:hypothetical protein
MTAFGAESGTEDAGGLDVGDAGAPDWPAAAGATAGGVAGGVAGGCWLRAEIVAVAARGLWAGTPVNTANFRRLCLQDDILKMRCSLGFR